MVKVRRGVRAAALAAALLALALAFAAIGCPRPTPTGPPCGAVTCAVGERCCMHCWGMCVAEDLAIVCPDDVDPSAPCNTDAAPPGTDGGPPGTDAG